MLKISDFIIKRQIGKGTYCDVNLVINKFDSKKYALKVVKFHDSTSEREKDNALAEVRYLASVQHPNVIAYKAAFIDEPSSNLW
jgi:NIMA (never in mitosis gene a)-related kinase